VWCADATESGTWWIHHLNMLPLPCMVISRSSYSNLAASPVSFLFLPRSLWITWNGWHLQFRRLICNTKCEMWMINMRHYPRPWCLAGFQPQKWWHSKCEWSSSNEIGGESRVFLLLYAKGALSTVRPTSTLKATSGLYSILNGRAWVSRPTHNLFRAVNSSQGHPKGEEDARKIRD
jgi:hypothetical protein